MFPTAYTVSEALERLRRRDSTLKQIYLFGHQYTDQHVVELVDCLLNNPNVVKRVVLGRNRLTDKTGIQLARYVASSSTIHTLSLHYNQFSDATYLAIAAALRINSSLKFLYLYGNFPMNRRCIDTTFIDALILNPSRSGSAWGLYSADQFEFDFNRLKRAAEELGHPSMQALLATLAI